MTAGAIASMALLFFKPLAADVWLEAGRPSPAAGRAAGAGPGLARRRRGRRGWRPAGPHHGHHPAQAVLAEVHGGRHNLLAVEERPHALPLPPHHSDLGRVQDAPLYVTLLGDLAVLHLRGRKPGWGLFKRQLPHGHKQRRLGWRGVLLWLRPELLRERHATSSGDHLLGRAGP
uniref:Putative secreted protein n=1 Tax=Ixodes ricinus TaxID=34613 RepID=A0A6B0UZ96_IXORI